MTIRDKDIAKPQAQNDIIPIEQALETTKDFKTALRGFSYQEGVRNSVNSLRKHLTQRGNHTEKRGKINGADDYICFAQFTKEQTFTAK